MAATWEEAGSDTQMPSSTWLTGGDTGGITEKYCLLQACTQPEHNKRRQFAVATNNVMVCKQ